MQMIECAKLAPRGRSARYPRENAFIDVTLVYARKLLAFMDPPPNQRDWRKGDVFACDYVDGWTIPASWWAGPNSAVMKAISTRAAHICLDRLDMVAWNIDAIAGSVTEAMRDFFLRLEEPFVTAFGVYEPTRPWENA